MEKEKDYGKASVARLKFMMAVSVLWEIGALWLYFNYQNADNSVLLMIAAATPAIVLLGSVFQLTRMDAKDYYTDYEKELFKKEKITPWIWMISGTLIIAINTWDVLKKETDDPVYCLSTILLWTFVLITKVYDIYLGKKIEKESE